MRGDCNTNQFGDLILYVYNGLVISLCVLFSHDHGRKFEFVRVYRYSRVFHYRQSLLGLPCKDMVVY